MSFRLSVRKFESLSSWKDDLFENLGVVGWVSTSLLWPHFPLLLTSSLILTSWKKSSGSLVLMTFMRALLDRLLASSVLRRTLSTELPSRVVFALRLLYYSSAVFILCFIMNSQTINRQPYFRPIKYLLGEKRSFRIFWTYPKNINIIFTIYWIYATIIIECRTEHMRFACTLCLLLLE